jgi:exopolysaccharide biosynthesis predicted pyruvyltransferase EpsI
MNLDLSTPEKIEQNLNDALAKIEKSNNYVLLDYPDNRNVGDHLIWLGSVFYLSDILKATINYAATTFDFSEIEMQKTNEKSPILLNGGGNLGDVWQRHQIFREKIISKYQDRAIIILPQTKLSRI